MIKNISEYIESLQSEKDDPIIIEMMQNNMDKEKPCVGIFWYDDRFKKLFGVRKYTLDDNDKIDKCSEGISCKELHKNVWKKEYNYRKFHNDNKRTYPFIGDWKDTPRGRIFYNYKDNIWYIYVGSWIKNNKEAFELIVDEFHLNEVEYDVKIKNHWELGNGWGD